MTVTCDKMLITLINQTVKLDDAIKTSPKNENDTIQKYMKNSMMKFLTKCGEPLSDCKTCKNVYPWGALSVRKATTKQEKRAVGGLRLMKIDGKPVPWGQRINVRATEKLPSINFRVPTKMEYVSMNPRQKNSLREGIRKAIQIQEASNKGLSLFEYQGYQARTKADLRRIRRAEKEKKSQQQAAERDRAREKRAAAKRRKQSKEERIGWLTGVRPKAPPEPPTSEKGAFPAQSGKFTGLPKSKFEESLLPPKATERLYQDLFKKSKRTGER